MRAMILAAGFGSRLGALTETTPKCLIEAGGKRLLHHAIDTLRAAGVTHIMVNTHYLAEQVDAFVGSLDIRGVTLQLSHEETLLGTGGGVYKVRSFFQDESEFIIYNSDVYSEIDLTAMVAAHRSSKALATLAVIERATSRPLLFDSEWQLRGWRNLKNDTGECFGDDRMVREVGFSGVHVVSPQVFEYCSGLGDPFSIITPYLAAAKFGECVQGFDVGSSYWIDVGVPERLELLRQRLGRKRELTQ